MLNLFYMYSVIWGTVLLLYSLGWSDLCSPLQPELKAFFSLTVVVSAFFGYIFRDTFTIKKSEHFQRRSSIITIVLIAACLLEYYVCAQIPLIAIITGTSDYTSFTGIPTLHTIIDTFALFYAQHLFFLFLCFPKKKGLLIEYAAIVIVAFLLQFNRGQILICAYISAALFTGINKKIKKRYWLILAVTAIVIMFAFGALGNMRMGYRWNDTSYFETLGMFNSAYPKWLPKQFMWPYIYITSPLSNLNYNATFYKLDVNLTHLFWSFIPDFISKRLLVLEAPLLKVPYFNVTSAFGEIYVRGGIIGMIIYWFVLLFFQWFVAMCLHSDNECKALTLGIMSGIVAFTFFTNTIAYSAISFVAIYPIVLFIFKKVKGLTNN